MSITKKIISKAISDEISRDMKLSGEIFESFLKNIKSNIAKQKTIKLSGFGSFINHNSPKRIGRNPKTLESFIINERRTIKFRVSNKIKKILN